MPDEFATSQPDPCTAAATVDTTSRLDALIALLISKGIITEEELKTSEKARENMQPPTVQDVPEAVQSPTQNQV